MSKQRNEYYKVVTHEKEDFAELFLYGYIGQDLRWLGDKYEDETITDLEVVNKLRQLEEEYPVIKVRINSPGGSVFHGDPIVNAIRSSKAEIHTYADGVVASMAADIWAAGKVRHMSLNSKLMIHCISTYTHGNALQLMEAAELLDKMDQVAIKAFAADTGMSETEVRERFYDHKDHWLTPEEALELGFISEIEDYKVELPVAEPEKMAYGELVKLYSPDAPTPTKSFSERLNALYDKIFNRTGDASPAPEHSTKQSTDMKLEDFQKSLADGELDATAVAEALEKQGYTVTKAEPAAPADPNADLQAAVAEAVKTALAERDAELAKLRAEVKALGDAPGAQPTGTQGDQDPPSGVTTGTPGEPDHLKTLADAANKGERVARG